MIYSLTVTVPLLSTSTDGPVSTGVVPSAMLTPVISSSAVTLSFRSQSPAPAGLVGEKTCQQRSSNPESELRLKHRNLATVST